MERTSSPSAEELFLAAIERAPRERGEFLDSACRGDTALRAEVEMLVACHDGAGEFLERSPAPIPLVVDDLDLARLPERIGKFRIVRLLGAGGMGCVYLAESQEPKRKVALKVVRPGLGTVEMSRRFRHEVQVVAVLQHPGIAQLYEAGAEATPGGPLPYFAMEYVEGPTITGYAREKGLGWKERMALLARVAEGVHHAHQKGVIHRDLKPANILVDAAGQPKILDFGVARLKEAEELGAGGGGGGGGMPTSPGQVVGTLSYMSPEQLAGDSRKVDARTDIYALGVVLYELLAGAPPFDVASGSLADAVRTIGEKAPRRLGEIDRRLRGDPEVIVGKAMAKDVGARYQSALELAADIGRCLADQTIMARRPSASYQLRKFVKRNKVLAGLAGAAVLSLVGGMVVSMWQARVAGEARMAEQRRATEASEAAARAEESAELSNAVKEFMLGLFESAQPSSAGMTGITVEDVLDKSNVDVLRKKFTGKPRLLAQVNLMIGRTYKSLSLLEKAEPHLVEAAGLMEEYFKPTAAERLEAQQSLGHLYKLEDRLDLALERLRDAEWIAELTYGARDKITLGLRNDVASVMLRGGDAPGAEAIYREAVNDALEALGPTDDLTLGSMNNLAAALIEEGRVGEALGIRCSVLGACLETWGERNHYTITAMANLGRDLTDAGWAPEAEPLLRRAAELRLRLQGPDHRSTLNTMCSLGKCLVQLGKSEEAEEILGDTVRRGERAMPEGNSDRARYMEEYGRVLAGDGQDDAGLTCLREAYSMFSATLGAGSAPAKQAAREVGSFYAERGMGELAREWDEKGTP